MNALENNNNTITKETAQSIISSRSLISGEGKFRVKVSQCNDYYKQEKYSNTVAIANFNAMTPYHKQQALAAGREGRFNDAVNFNLSLSIREGQYKPTKGETVDIIVEYVTLKSGETALLVTSMTPLQATKATKVSDFSFDDEVPSSTMDAPELDDITVPTKATVKA